MNYKSQLPALIAASVFALFSMNAQADNTQQSKMKTCNADASTQKLTGDERKAYLKTCLSAKAPATATTPAATPAAATASTPKLNSQQQKMKTCNADATAQKLTGDARKAYLKTCLSAKAPAVPAAAATPTAAK